MRPMFSGYRPNHDFGLDHLNDAQHEYPDGHRIEPGGTERALLWLLAPEIQEGRLYQGMEFKVQEGGRVVGHGRVLRVLNDRLQDSEKARVFREIDRILWESWDPIGVYGCTEARDEYGSYVKGVLALLTEGLDELKIAEHLHSIETLSMGLPGNLSACRRVAAELSRIDV